MTSAQEMMWSSAMVKKVSETKWHKSIAFKCWSTMSFSLAYSLLFCFRCELRSFSFRFCENLSFISKIFWLYVKTFNFAANQFVQPSTDDVEFTRKMETNTKEQRTDCVHARSCNPAGVRGEEENYFVHRRVDDVKWKDARNRQVKNPNFLKFWSNSYSDLNGSICNRSKPLK